jgi:hypothetical protein
MVVPFVFDFLGIYFQHAILSNVRELSAPKKWLMTYQISKSGRNTVVDWRTYLLFKPKIFLSPSWTRNGTYLVVLLKQLNSVESFSFFFGDIVA